MGPYFCSLTTQDLQRVILWFHWLTLLCIWHFHKTLLFWEVQSSCDLVLVFVLFGKLCLGNGCWLRSGIQVTYVAELLCVYIMVMQLLFAECCLQPSRFSPCCSVSWIHSTRRMFSCSGSPHCSVLFVMLCSSSTCLCSESELTWACSGVSEIRGK